MNMVIVMKLVRRWGNFDKHWYGILGEQKIIRQSEGWRVRCYKSLAEASLWRPSYVKLRSLASWGVMKGYNKENVLFELERNFQQKVKDVPEELKEADQLGD